MNLSKESKLVLVKAAQGSAGTAIDTDSVDMAGYEGVMFFGTIATANAGNFANVAQSANDSSFADLADTKVVPSTNGNSFLIDVVKPQERYVRCEIDRSGTNTATGDIYALLYSSRKSPTTHGTTIQAETHISPEEGTA